MIKSKNDSVQNFLDETSILDHTKYEILEALRKIVFEYFPEATEKMMYGGIIFSNTEDFGGIFAYKNHVSFEFSLGFKLNDPDKVLEGNGKFRRHLKVRAFDEIETKKVAFFVDQISTLEE